MFSEFAFHFSVFFFFFWLYLQILVIASIFRSFCPNASFIFPQVKRLVVIETEKMYKARKQNEANHRAVRPPLVINHLPTSCQHFHLESAFLLMQIFGGQLCFLKCSLVAQAICFQAVILLKVQLI